MKNLSLILNGILAVAVIVLYILHFSGKESGQAVAQDGGQASLFSAEGLTIAYVNSDSLLQNYDFFKEMAKKMEARQEKLNKEYQNRAIGLQGEIENFQRSANNMTMTQAKAVEEDLRRKQQNLMAYQEGLAQELMAEEGKINAELYEKVSSYLSDYGKNKGLQLVLTYQKGSGVLYANDSMNITNDVIKGLNDQYIQEKSGDSAKPAAKSDTTSTTN
ncbi:MAG: OmpH family outer membrane protein [Cyclobacteriaceae bacterium]